MLRRFLKLTVFLLCLGIVTLLIITGLAATESGSRWLVNRVIDINDIPVTIGKVSGRLLDEINFQDLHYRDSDENEFSADKIKLVWSPVYLLKLDVNITSIISDQLTIKLADTSTGSPVVLKIDYPALPVNIDKLELNKTQIIYADGKQLIEHARASLVSGSDKIVLRLEKIQSADQQLTGIATLTRKKIPEFNIDLQWSGMIENDPARGHLQLDGPQNNLALGFELESTNVSIKAHGKLDLIKVPHNGTLQGEISGILPNEVTTYVKQESPLLFNLKGNTKFIEGNFSTKLQTESGEKLAFNMESYVALPGATSNSLNINLDWKTTTEQENPLLNLSGQGEFEYQNKVLTIEHELTMPYAIHLDGKINFNNQPNLDLKLGWKNIQHQVSDDMVLQVPSGSLNVTGALDSLIILAKTRFNVAQGTQEDHTNSADTFTYLSIDGKLNTTTEHPTGEINGTLNTPVPAVLQKQIKELKPLLFHVGLEPETIDLTVTGSGQTVNIEPFDLALNSKLYYPQENEESLNADIEWSLSPERESIHLERIAGNGKLQYKNNQIVISQDLISPFTAKLDGDVVLNREKENILRFDISWQDLEIPVQGAVPILSERGHGHIEGSATSLAIDLNSHLRSSPLGPADTELTANWSGAVLNFTRLNIRATGGYIQGTGQIMMDENIHGQFDLDAHNINLESINPDLVSKIDITAKVGFAMEDEGINVFLQVPTLSGDWRGHPLRGNAEISRTENQINIRDLHIESGKNRIDMQLDMHQALAGYIDLSITDMSVFSSGMAGTVKGRFDIGGTREAMRIDGQMGGKNIDFFDLHIASIKADSLIDLGPKQNSSLEIDFAKFQYKDWLIDKLTINGSGLAESHSLELTASSEKLVANARLNGQLHNKNWQGLINQLNINTPDTGEWKLKHPSEITFQGETKSYTVNDTCLEQKDANLCLAVSGIIQNDGKVTIQLDRLPIAMVQPWLPESVSLDGAISGNIYLKQLNDHWELQTSLEGTGTQISVGYDKDTDTLAVQKFSLKAEATHNRRELNLQLSSPEYFDIQLDSSIENTGTRPIFADIKVDLHKIDWLAGIEPALAGTKGQFEARVKASGTLDQPVIQGEFNLLNGQLSIIPAGLDLDHVSCKLQSGNESNQMLINLVLGSNGKQLEVKGDARLDAEQNYPYRLHVFGENFPMVRTADVTMDVSPDLDLYGSLLLHYVRGNIVVPFLDMQVTSLPEDSITVSPDTVIVQSKKAGAVQIEEDTRSSDFIRHRLDVDVNVKSGPDIHISGFGLDTKLAGDINIVKPVDIYQPRGEGFVNLSDGSYRAYGQNLVIEKGQLQFAGPLDNPGINVYAYRPNLKVRPGIKVVGNIHQPKLSLYSVPAMSDADTLSYLITGRPITGVSSNEDANLLAQAALTLGTQESSVLTSQIESMFGLEDFSVGAGDTYQSTSVNATKKLSPNLTFRPSFNPFDQLWTFLLNYRLTDHWSVQAESGVSQGGDIIYSIDTNKISELFKNIRLW